MLFFRVQINFPEVSDDINWSPIQTRIYHKFSLKILPTMMKQVKRRAQGPVQIHTYDRRHSSKEGGISQPTVGRMKEVKKNKAHFYNGHKISIFRCWRFTTEHIAGIPNNRRAISYYFQHFDNLILFYFECEQNGKENLPFIVNEVFHVFLVVLVKMKFIISNTISICIGINFLTFQF